MALGFECSHFRCYFETFGTPDALSTVVMCRGHGVLTPRRTSTCMRRFGMRRTRVLIAMGAVVALAVLGGATQAGATSTSFRPPADSLRALGAPYGLRIGSAINPFDLDTPAYAQISGDQFSTVTPENEMKWQIVEPTQGTYDWSG